MNEISFSTDEELKAAIIQDWKTGQVRMLGYMNRMAYELTKQIGKVHFYSRSKQRLWMKGESSGNFLLVKSIFVDCDGDALLVLVEAKGPTCHTGNESCFNLNQELRFHDDKEVSEFMNHLEKIIQHRLNQKENDTKSYTRLLAEKGISYVGRKVGEEAIEVLVEAMKRDLPLFLQEMADLIYHQTVLMHMMGCSWKDVECVLKSRHEEKQKSSF